MRPTDKLIHQNCPACHAEITLGSSSLNKKIHCPKCRNVVIIPAGARLETVAMLPTPDDQEEVSRPKNGGKAQTSLQSRFLEEEPPKSPPPPELNPPPPLPEPHPPPPPPPPPNPPGRIHGIPPRRPLPMPEQAQTDARAATLARAGSAC